MTTATERRSVAVPTKLIKPQLSPRDTIAAYRRANGGCVVITRDNIASSEGPVHRWQEIDVRLHVPGSVTDDSGRQTGNRHVAICNKHRRVHRFCVKTMSFGRASITAPYFHDANNAVGVLHSPRLQDENRRLIWRWKLSSGSSTAPSSNQQIINRENRCQHKMVDATPESTLVSAVDSKVC